MSITRNAVSRHDSRHNARRGAVQRPYTPAEVAALLGVSMPTMYGYLQRGELPLEAVQAGRRWFIPRPAVERFLQGERI